MRTHENGKLIALCKKYQWLKTLDPDISKMDDVKVERFDSKMLFMKAGICLNEFNRRTVRGYFVDEGGNIIGNIHPIEKPRGCLKRFVEVGLGFGYMNKRSVAEALNEYGARVRDLVRFVVFVRDENREPNRLHFIRLHDGQTMTDVLNGKLSPKQLADAEREIDYLLKN